MLKAAVRAAGLLDTWLYPENKGVLAVILTDHVAGGKMDAAFISGGITDGIADGSGIVPFAQ